MRQKTRRALFVIAGLLVSAAAVLFFAYRLKGNWDEVLDSFARANYLYLIPAVGALVVLYWCRVVRWRLFLKPIRKVRRIDVTSATCIGFMTNCVLPARVGELVRPYVLHRNAGVKFGHALATAAGLERVFDLVGLAILMLMTWLMLSAYVPAQGPPAAGGAATAAAAPEGAPAAATSPDGRPQHDGQIMQQIWRTGIVFAVLAGVRALVLVGVALFPRVFHRVAEVCTAFLPHGWREPIREFLYSITDAMGFLKNARGVALAILFSMGLWFAQGLSTQAVAAALGIEIGLAGSFLVVIAVAAAVAVPQGPAFMGPFHVAAMLAAGSFGVGRGAAGAFALLMWAVNVVPITVVGLAFLWYEGLSLRQLTAASREIEERQGEGQG